MKIQHKQMSFRVNNKVYLLETEQKFDSNANDRHTKHLFCYLVKTLRRDKIIVKKTIDAK